MLALEEKVPIAGAAARPRARGSPRAGWRTCSWRPELVPELVVATDVYTWKLLRRDQGLSRDETAGGDVANRASSTRTEDSMTTPKRYLFAIIDGGGTVPADTSVIRAMVERGHDVRVLADRVLAPDIETHRRRARGRGTARLSGRTSTRRA